MNGRTASFVAVYGGTAPFIAAAGTSFLSDLPIITQVAMRATFSPAALLTNGTVRDARGLASST